MLKIWIANILGLSFEEKVSLFTTGERIRLAARFNVSDSPPILEPQQGRFHQRAEIDHAGTVVKEGAQYGRE